MLHAPRRPSHLRSRRNAALDYRPQLNRDGIIIFCPATLDAMRREHGRRGIARCILYFIRLIAFASALLLISSAIPRDPRPRPIEYDSTCLADLPYIPPPTPYTPRPQRFVTNERIKLLRSFGAAHPNRLGDKEAPQT